MGVGFWALCGVVRLISFATFRQKFDKKSRFTRRKACSHIRSNVYATLELDLLT